LKISQDFEKKVKGYKRRVEMGAHRPLHTNRVQTEILKNYYGRAKARNFEFFSDEPENGGENRAPRPLEYFLAGFAFCQQVQYAKYAALQGIDLSDLKIDVRGHVDARGIFEIGDVKPGFWDIKYVVKIKTSEDEDTIIDLIKKVERICPAHAALRSSLDLEREAIINGKRVQL